MKLLPRVLRSCKRWLRADSASLALWILVFTVLEVLGRKLDAEGADAAGIVILGGLACLTFFWHRRASLFWVAGIMAAFQRVWLFLKSLGIHVGVDLRETPPIRPAIPPFFLGTFLLLLAAVAGLVLTRDLFPDRARDVLASVFYSGYLILLMAFWGWLVIGTLLHLFLPLAVIHDAFVCRYSGQGRRSVRTELKCMAACVLLLVLAGILLPAWVPFVAAGAIFLLSVLVLLLPINPPLMLLWRRLRRVGTVRRLDYRWMAGFQIALLAMSGMAVMLLALGEQLFPAAAARTGESMPITTTLGLVFSWSALAGLGALTYLILKSIVLAWILNPASPCRPILYFHGAHSPALRSTLRDKVRGDGWDVRFAPALPRPTDVQVKLEAESGGAPPARWPRQIKPEDLEDTDSLRRLHRRDEIQKRRLLIRGLRKLFKRAARRTFKNGEGFWIGLQHWYVMGLSRDTDEEELDMAEGALFTEIIGAPYHVAFSRPVRHYFGKMMARLEVDLMFVEDGVGFHRLQKVLRVLFEIYDIHGGKQKAEDKHFLGIPGVRVLLHEIDMERPFMSFVYPEPDYDDVGRARILHVFKDRGEEYDLEEDPVDLESLPAPMGQS